MVSFSATPVARPNGGIRIELPFDPAEAWGDREVYYLAGTLDGCPLRCTVNPSSGSSHMDLGPTWVRDAPVELDRMVPVDLAPEEPQFPSLSEDLRAAIGSDTEAKKFFDSLPTAYRKGFVSWVEDAKRADTRRDRVTKTAEALSRRQRKVGG